MHTLGHHLPFGVSTKRILACFFSHLVLANAAGSFEKNIPKFFKLKPSTLYSCNCSSSRKVKTSTDESVTRTVCSHCADSLRSLVTAVHPSAKTSTCQTP